MVDKLKLWADRAIVGEQLPTIATYLDRAKQQTDLQTGEIITSGNIEGLKVVIYTGGLSVIGSMPKFLYGSNVYPLTRHTIKDAIEKISDTLHIHTEKADVTELEFGTNFLMKHPVADYLSKLGEMPRLERVQVTPTSVRYQGRGKRHPKEFSFYDKLADAASKGMNYPEDMKGQNLLRYEIRLSGRLPQQLSVPQVIASTLTEKGFYRLMVKRYQDDYFRISKQNQVKTDVMSEIKTPTDAFNVFVARLLSQTDKSQIAGFLDELKQAGVFEDRKNYTRVKSKIREVATKANFTISDELIKELDDEVRNCGAYV